MVQKQIFYRRTESNNMTFTTRRARIESEQAELLALRSRRTKKFSMSVATLATAASASFIGMAPANAAMDDAPAPAASSSSSNTASTNSTGAYTVQSGDTLASIANSQGVSLDALLNANGLNTSSTIYPGDVLQSGDVASGESSATSEDASVGPNSGESSAADSDVSTVSTASTGSGATGTTAATSAAVDIVNSGATYQYGGNGPSAYDCSGFTKAAFAEAGVELPRTTGAQFSGASSYDSLDNVQEGDLIFWSNNGSESGIYHVAVYIDGQIAQARNRRPVSALTPCRRTRSTTHHGYRGTLLTRPTFRDVGGTEFDHHDVR